MLRIVSRVLASATLVGTLAWGSACSHTNAEAQKTKKAESSEESTADKHYKVALGSFHNSLYDDARMQLQRALTAEPDHGPARYLEGLMYLQDGKTMLDAIEGEMCLQDASSELQRDRVDGLHRKAHEAFTKAAEGFDEKAAGHGRALNSMAVVSLYFREFDRAVEEADGALKSDFYSERFSALANLGWAYYQRGDRVEAMTELRQSVLLNPEFCVARYRLAQVYLDFDMNEQALEEIERVLNNERCPIQDARRVEGVARMRLGDPRAATGSFDACISMAPRSCLADECAEYLELASAEASSAPPPAG